MKTSRLLALLSCIFCTFSLSAQLDFKLQLMPDGTKWGVYVKPRPGTIPTNTTITATGQITLVAPIGFSIVDLNPVSGNWINNSVSSGPTENPTKTYISFGLVSDDPQIHYSATAATLLLTFKKANSFCPDEFYLIENTVDPFDHLPNSANSNPGNEITVLDLGTTPFSTYQYGQNYAPFAWDCHDCDGDGIPNALEDTNGNGVYDPTIDVSDLCNGSGGGGCIAITGAQLHCQGGGTACGNNPAGQISLVVDITGGQAPFTVKYTDGSAIFTLQDYQSGTPFNAAATNGAVYKVTAITGNDGCEAATNSLSGTVPVTILGALQFTTQPADALICPSTSALFEACATATNSSFDIRWEYSSNQTGAWLPINTTTGLFQVNNSSDGCSSLYLNEGTGLNGYRFRAVAEGPNAPAVNSQPATLNLKGPLVVTTNPTNVKICDGESITFSAAFANLGTGDIKYTWQLSHNDGLTWWDGMPGQGISGINAPTLTMQTIHYNANGDIYRLRAQVDGCDFYYTQPASITVEGPVKILSLISPIAVCRGEQACFEVQADLFGSGQLSYQWQERAAGSTTWTDVQGASASIFCLSNTEGQNGYCYRAQVRTANCPAVTSVEACLVVEDKAVFAQQPQTTTTCAGETATLTATAAIETDYAGQLAYRWQTSADGGQSWQDLDEDSNFSGAFGNTLTISDAASLGNLLYRLSATSGICEASYSYAATVTIEGPVEISEQPAAMTVCPGSVASFNAAANLLGAGNLHLQWQSSANGISWSNIAEGNDYTGTQSGTLTVQNATVSRMFRLGASTGVCEAKYTEPAMLTVEAPILFSLQPETAVVCPDESASFSIAVGGALGALSLQWQSSLDGQTWADIADGSNFAGAQTSTLAVGEATGLDGTQFRLKAASQNCTAYSASGVLVLEADAICNPIPTNYDCVSLAVKKLDGGIGWSVWVKADSSFTETPYQLPTSGKVTLVAPMGFAIQGLTSHNGGKWKFGKVVLNPAKDPGKVYFELNLTPNQNFLELTPGAERLLFTFSAVNGCPNALSLMDEIVPTGFSPNEFAGFGAGLTAESIPFHACGVYGKETWNCPPALSLMAPTGNNTVASGQMIELNPTTEQVDFGKLAKAESLPNNFFGVSPNPVRDELKVAFDESILGKTASLRLLNLQGQVVLHTVIEGEAIHRLDMSGSTPGIYFLTLEVDGKLVQREKVIVQ